ncbi:MAG: YggT family protein [Gammaproteobacteria bacterium]|nr:YggT family protein [Gammaproteobacteria bacterium]MDH5691979.1 YggT family protein [Gammaproteobacteria bacterium]
MGNQYVDNAGIFLINFLFGFFLLLIMVRMIMGMVRADFKNPISQFIVKLTNPALVPLRRVIPPMGGIDTASVLLLFVLQALEVFLIGAIRGHSIVPAGIAVLSIAGLLSLLLKVYIFGILIQVVLSWVSPQGYNPVAYILYQINEPVLRQARRFVPPISGFDLSPIIVTLVLYLASMLLIAPITDLGYQLARGG